ncbi:hypothetical protein QBC46DRAFT_429343 [Diplogelasinospora grovesii]|uniref:FAD-binding PCMH-type domain-containing protein n=1 Tax=Diplogelasinospora grovesii TaxID=303347 RepID=A0AAN6MW44_9PEZI|nr:hypothetical protein QBC46DRAFT_429343 [Diplogelasinospora grovesii]
MLRFNLLSFVSLAASLVHCTNFPWEEAQLTRNETLTYPDIAFGDDAGANDTYTTGPKCKVGPGAVGWPTTEEWDKFNRTLGGGGVLLKPVPPGAACYPGSSPHYDPAKCAFLLTNASFTRFYSDDPVTILTDWPEGNTCVASPFPTGNCTQGGYPVYVVNATRVRHIQMGINFARNRNLRLVIKNSGHDFAGRSTGAGALSIWTHFLKDFEYIPEYAAAVGNYYKGRVAKVSAGIEAWELWNHMATYNMTMVVPGGDTVGAYGGWSAGGGHNSLSSYYGLGSDSVLSFQVVTADGQYRSVSPYQNADLFFAMLGGGGSTFGVLTSAIVKVHPLTQVTSLPLAFSVGSARGLNFSFPGNLSFPFPGNFSLPGMNSSILPTSNWTFPGFPRSNASRPGAFGGRGSAPVVVNSTRVFWEGVRLYQYFAPVVTDAGGTLYSYVTKIGNNGIFTFTTTFEMPSMSPREVQTLVAPLFAALNKAGIPVVNRLPDSTPSFSAAARTGAGDSPGNVYFASRLFPRANWDNETIYNNTFAAIRTTVEAGYTFHGINHSPNYTIAGFPGNITAINPAWRSALMHADIFDYSFRSINGVAPQAVKDGHARLNKYMDIIRAATPTGGSYINEADVLEPNWQESFFGSNYARLVQIKKARDPWGLFWAPTTPGSEAWAVITADGLPTQNGPLCQTGYEEGGLK